MDKQLNIWDIAEKMMDEDKIGWFQKLCDEKNLCGSWKSAYADERELNRPKYARYAAMVIGIISHD